MIQYADPAVSRRKFEAELAEYHAQEAVYRARGWLLLKAEFPNLLFAMVAVHLPVLPVVLGAAFDYTNYDAEPPSLGLVNPFTGEPYIGTVPTLLYRPKGPATGGLPFVQQVEQLLQGSPDSIPFLCVPGVREYHDHPAHTGDPWELHRAAGAGRFVRLLEILDEYGVKSQQIAMQIQPVLSGTGRFLASLPQ